jgi:hypothetical protein
MQVGFGLSVGISAIEKTLKCKLLNLLKKVDISSVYISGFLAAVDVISALGFSSRFLLSLMDDFPFP